MRVFLSLLFVCFSVSSWNDVLAQAIIPDLFASEDILSIRLTGDLPALLADIEEDRLEHTLTLSYEDSIGQDVALPVRVRTRGNWRRNPDHCNFPPLRLNFQKKVVVGTLFENQDKLKLVTHCQDDDPRFIGYVLREYLIYRLYNRLTDASFRVRLLNVTYADSTGDREVITRHGFLIEEDIALADRLGLLLAEMPEMGPTPVDHSQETLLHLFSYIVGNIDWSLEQPHNAVLLQKESFDTVVPVPYDFDHAGFVGAHYADRMPPFGMTSPRYLLFNSFCRNEEELTPALQVIETHRDDLRIVVADFPHLTLEERRRGGRFVERRIAHLMDPDERKRLLLDSCRMNR